MAGIPPSTAAGLRRLHERAITALGRQHESRDVEFKTSAPWSDLEFKLIKTIMAMANLRDGGVILVGVGESDKPDLAGIKAADLATYDIDEINDRVGRYASPHVDLEFGVATFESKQFLVIHVREFADSPVVCKKAHDSASIVCGAVYMRTPGKPQTTRVMDASQMHELLELAAEKRARRILEVSRRVGMVPEEPAAKRFADQLGGL